MCIKLERTYRNGVWVLRKFKIKNKLEKRRKGVNVTLFSTCYEKATKLLLTLKENSVRFTYIF